MSEDRVDHLYDVRPRNTARRPTKSPWKPKHVYDPPEPPTEEQKIVEQAQLEQAARIGQEARGRARIKPRKTVDYFGSITRWQMKRKLQTCPDEIPGMRPTYTYLIDLLPPAAYLSNSSLGLTTRYTHTSTNKIRTPINCVRWTPEGRRVLTGSTSGEFTMWNGLTFNFETILQAHDAPIRAMEWSHSGNWLVSGDSSGTLKYFQPNMNNLQRFQGHPEAVRDVSFAPNDSRFVTGGDDGSIKIWNFDDMQEEKTWMGHGWDVRCVKWHPTKGLLVSGGKDSIVKFWDPRTTKVLQSLHGHKHYVQAVSWNPNGNTVATASRDSFVKVYDIRLMRELYTLRGHKKEVCSLVWNPIHHDQLASGGSDGSILHWSIDSSGAFSMSNQDDSMLMSAASGGATNVDISTPTTAALTSMVGAPIESIEYAHDSNVWSLAYHPLGHMLASGSNDHTVRFWSRNRPSGRDGKGGAGFGGLGGGRVLWDRFHVGREKAKELAGGVEQMDEADEHDIPLPGLAPAPASLQPSISKEGPPSWGTTDPEMSSRSYHSTHSSSGPGVENNFSTGKNYYNNNNNNNNNNNMGGGGRGGPPSRPNSHHGSRSNTPNHSNWGGPRGRGRGRKRGGPNW